MNGGESMDVRLQVQRVRRYFPLFLLCLFVTVHGRPTRTLISICGTMIVVSGLYLRLHYGLQDFLADISLHREPRPEPRHDCLT